MSDSVAPAAETNSEDGADRATERRSFFLNAVISIEERGGFVARIRNLSAGGMMVELDQAPDPEWAPGERVATELRNIGTVKGEIAWAGGRRFGVRFDREIDPELARKPVAIGSEILPDYLKPIRVPDRALGRLTQAMKRH
jgi:hypothetical protein